MSTKHFLHVSKINNILVKLIGFHATLIHGDTLVYDRWRWLKSKIHSTTEKKDLLDVGCGTGAFTIGTALRGYNSLGLSWDHRNNEIASQRARICGANTAEFRICDVRKLDLQTDLIGKFDIVICTENIEHIINDQKLMNDISMCLKPEGLLYLTTPNIDFIPMHDDVKLINQPPVEDGGHVVIGYSQNKLEELAHNANLEVISIEFCSGFFSQKVTSMMRYLYKINRLLGWILILPLRILPLFDKYIHYTGYSICMTAKKL